LLFKNNLYTFVIQNDNDTEMEIDMLTDLSGNPTTTYVIHLDAKLGKDDDATLQAVNELRQEVRALLHGAGMIPSAKIVGDGFIMLHSVASSDATCVIFMHDDEIFEPFVRIAVVPVYSRESINETIKSFGYELDDTQHDYMYKTLEDLHNSVFEPERLRISQVLMSKYPSMSILSL
jgi:hypothetical protein